MTPQEQLENRRLVQDPQDSVYETEGKHFIEPLIVLAKHKVLLLGIVVGVALLSIVIALLLPQYFTAEAKLLPPQQGGRRSPSLAAQSLQREHIYTALGEAPICLCHQESTAGGAQILPQSNRRRTHQNHRDHDA